MIGQVVHTDTPQFLGFVFDTPTTTLPLPDYAYRPNPFGRGLLQEPFSMQNIVVSTPEPATILLFAMSDSGTGTSRSFRRDGVFAEHNGV